MKPVLFILAALSVISCDHDTREKEMQSKMDTLQKNLDNSYKPGLGEFMTGLQLHHAKLWFAGQEQNWPLADFEIKEMEEGLEDIRKYCSDRQEVSFLKMINGPIDSIDVAIRQKDPGLFKNDFILLTTTCNNCHRTTGHGFNVVTIPANLPVVNQDFKPLH